MSTSTQPAKFSLALSAKKPSGPPTRTKRPHSTLRDSDDEDAATAAPRHQEVSHFDLSAGGAIDVTAADKQSSGPLVIPSRPNKDWAEEGRRRKRQRHALPAEAQAAKDNGVSTRGDEDEGIGGVKAFGLNVVAKPASGANGTADVTLHSETNEPAPAPVKPKTEDELALEALLGDAPKPTLVIPAVADEDETFKRDYDAVPDMSTYEDYLAVPVDGYGAALLRGMGWKEGEAVCRRRGQQAAVEPRIRDPRSALLGVGAKEEAIMGVEVGKGIKGGKTKKKVDQMYNPVLLRNTKTGELVTEEELKKMTMEQEKAGGKDDFVFEGKKRRSPSRDRDREPNRDRHRDRDRDRDRKDTARSSKHRGYDDDDRPSDDYRSSRQPSKHQRHLREDSADDRDSWRRRDGEERERKSHRSSRRERSPSYESRSERPKRRDDSDRDTRRRREKGDRKGDERGERDGSRREFESKGKKHDSERRRRDEVY